jgi:hypothetical protein
MHSQSSLRNFRCLPHIYFRHGLPDLEREIQRGWRGAGEGERGCVGRERDQEGRGGERWRGEMNKKRR